MMGQYMPNDEVSQRGRRVGNCSTSHQGPVYGPQRETKAPNVEAQDRPNETWVIWTESILL